jgi:molybdopterin-guanine dinucleotide biosynthesis protein A
LTEPIGVVLAGGLGRRIGGSKATVELHGKPLVAYPLEAMRGVLSEVAIIAKPDTELPDMAGVTLWIEPPGRRHPLVGIVHALGLAAGRAVLVCAADLPFVSPAVIGRLAGENPRGAPAVIATCDGAVQPLLGCYQPGALELLAGPAEESGVTLREAIASIRPRLLEVDDPDTLFNINTPDELLQAAAMLDRRRRQGR